MKLSPKNVVSEISTWFDSPGTSSTSQRLVSLVLSAVKFFKSLREYPDKPDRADPPPVSGPVPPIFGLSRRTLIGHESFVKKHQTKKVFKNRNL